MKRKPSLVPAPSFRMSSPPRFPQTPSRRIVAPPSGGVVVKPPVPGYDLWCRADLGITLNSSKVARWADQSGSGHDFTALDAQQPTLVLNSATMKGDCALKFAGAHKMITGALTVAQPVTIILVARASALSGNPGLIDDGTTRQLGYVASSGPNWAMDAGSTLSGGTPDTVMHKFAFVFDGASSKLYIDTTSAPVLSGDAGSGSGTGGLVIGTQSTGFWNGEISEFAKYPRHLTTTELDRFFEYVDTREVSFTPRSTIAADGNSIMVGDLATVPATEGFAFLAAQFFDAQFVNNALEGASTPTVELQSTQFTDPQYSPLRPKNLVLMLEVVNDYNTNGHSVATCIANLKDYVTARHAVGWTVVMCTVLPNYVISEPDRAAINALILAGATGADDVCDLASEPIMGNHANITNTTYYVDQLHPTTLGHSLLAPIAREAIRANF